MREDKNILVLFAFALILFVTPVRLKKGILQTPDEAAHLSTAKNLIENSSFYIKNTDYIYNEKYNTNFLHALNIQLLGLSYIAIAPVFVQLVDLVGRFLASMTRGKNQGATSRKWAAYE